MNNTICEGIDNARKQTNTMLQMTDINEFRLETFIKSFERAVQIIKPKTTHLQDIEFATEWIGGVSNWTLEKFVDKMVEPESSWEFFYKYEQLHKDLSAYLVLVNFIRRRTTSFGDDDFDNLNHILKSYQGWKKHGMMSLIITLRADGLDIIDIPFDDFVKLEHTLQNPY